MIVFNSKHTGWLRLCGFICAIFFAAAAPAQEVIEELIIVGQDTVIFAAQIPENYSPDAPPAILIWWHQWGGSQYEVFTHTEFDSAAEDRGWILASHLGPNLSHWNTRRAQFHCEVMLDWLADNFPFARDSIYMIGGSMGGAAGQVWHNNNCGSDDYLIAGTAGASQIIDCQLRQEQYLADGDTNRSMVREFGGLPDSADSIAYEYHRYSAIFLADTSESMHFNSLTLPVLSTWGDNDFEWMAYGDPALEYETYRAGNPQRSHFFPAGFSGHGLQVMNPNNICDWLALFTVNRFPDNLSISADEDDDYYFTTVELDTAVHTFARYGVSKDPASKRLDVSLLRNVRQLAINFDFPWSEFDSLSGFWSNSDASVPEPLLLLRSVPPVDSVYRNSGTPVHYTFADSTLSVILDESAEYTVVFLLISPPPVPRRVELIAAYPNPFNSQVTLEIRSPLTQRSTLLIHDIQSRLSRSIEIELTTGTNHISLSIGDLASGTYFARIKNSSASPIHLIHLK